MEPNARYCRSDISLSVSVTGRSRVPVHIPQAKAQFHATPHCYEVSAADAQGNLLSDDQTITCCPLPAMVLAVKGQQAMRNVALIYFINNTGEYEVIQDHTIVAHGAPILKSAHIASALKKVNVE